MDGAGHPLPAGTGFAGDQHRRVARCDPANEIEAAHDGGALVDDAGDWILGGRGTQPIELVVEREVIECAAERDVERTERHRFGDVVVCAGSDRGHRDVGAVSPGENDR